MKLRPQGAAPHRGLALIAVLWMVAALSILVGGITKTVKAELKATGFARQTVQAKATGEAAMQIAIQALIASGERPQKIIEAPITYAGQTVMVRMVPMNGYIDLNRAPVGLLQAVFQHGAGLDEGSATAVVTAIEAIRNTPGASGNPARFESVEDLLQVPGVSYPLYAKVAPLLTTDAGGGGRVNVQAAPPEVLNVVAGGNMGAVGSFLQSRGGDNVGADTSFMNGAWIDSGSASRTAEFSARVPMSDGDAIVVVRKYFLRPSPKEGLPWRAFGASSRVELASLPKP